MNFNMTGSFVTSTTIAAGLSIESLDAKMMNLDTNVAYTAKTFAIGVYEASAANPIDLYFDNVRCR
jgi:hypothetical protein